MSKRSTVLIVIGVAVFVVGAGLVLVSLGTRGGNSPNRANLTSIAGQPVVITTGAVPAGTTGETLIESGKVVLQRIPSREYSADDVTSLTQLEQQSLVRGLGPGTPVQTSDLSPSAGPLAPPKGDESVAVTLNSGAAGLAGYLQPGDDVDIYGNLIKGSGNLTLPCVTMIATKVEVLDVSNEIPAYRSNPTSAGRTVPGSITVLLAVKPDQAPQVVFYADDEQLYLVATNQASVTASGSCSAVAANGSLVPAP